MSRVVVFKNSQELYELRELLFGSVEAQKRGIERSKAFEVRGPLPPSVHTTCLILAAIHGDIPSSDLYVTRQAYAMALIRFVNEILDAAQVGKSVVPLYALAAEANLPAAFVELRHAATHETLPSIYVLRDMAKRALSWLYEEYWVYQEGVQHSNVPPSLEGCSTEERIKGLLREWRRVKRADGNSDVPPCLVPHLREMFKKHETEFLGVVIHRNILVPAGSGSVKNREAVVSMWCPLFMQLGAKFCTMLVRQIVEELSTRDWPPSQLENRRFAMLEHWAEVLAFHCDKDTVQLLGKLPRPWNAQLIAKHASLHRNIECYKVAEEMAFLTGTELNYEYDKGSSSGWRVVSSWTPRPIGIR